MNLDPGSVVVRYNLGYAYLSRGQAYLAIEEFRTVLALRPNDADAYNNLGNAYSAMGHFDSAIEQYLAALSLNPNIVEVRYNLATFSRYVSRFIFSLLSNQT